MSMGGLPQVGAQAILAGVAEFNSAARQIIGQLSSLNAATKELGDVSVNSWSRMSSQSGISTGAIIRSAGLVTAALGAASAAISELGQAGKVETEFKTIQGVSKSTSDEINGLTTTLVKLSDQYGESIGKLASTSTLLNRAGLSLQDVRGGALAATEALITASRGELTVLDATQALVQGLTTYHMAASQSDEITNALARAANSTTATFGDLAAALKYVGGAAAGLGESFAGTTAAIAVMAENSVRGSTAGTSLRAMLTALEKPTKDARAEMQKYHVSLFDAQGQFIGLRNLIIELSRAFGDQAVQQGKLTEMERANALARIFTTRGAQAATALARSGVEQYDAALKGEITTQEIANTVMSSAENQVKRFATSLQTLSTSALLPLLPAIADVARNATELVIAFRPDALTTFQDVLTALSNTFGNVRNTLAPVVTSIIALAQSIGRLASAAGGVDSVMGGFNAIINEAARIATIFFAGLSVLVDKLAEYPAVVTAASVALAVLGAVLAIDLVLAAGAAFAALLTPITLLAAPVFTLAGAFATLAISMAGVLIEAVIGLTVAFIAFAPEIAVVLIGIGLLAVGFNQLALLGRVAGPAVTEAIAAMVTTAAAWFDAFLNAIGVTFDGAIQIVVAFAGAIPGPLGVVVSAIGSMVQFAHDLGISWASVWASIANVAIDAINAIIRAIGQLANVPGIEAVPGVGPIFALMRGMQEVQRIAPGVIAAVGGIPGAIEGAFSGAAAAIESNIKKAHDSIQALIADTQAKLSAAQNQAALEDQRRGERGSSTAPVRQFPDEPPDALGYPPSGGGGGGGRGRKPAGPTLLDLKKEIAGLLADIPGMTKGLVDLLATIAKDYPERLLPMVTAIRNSKDAIGQAVIAKRDLLSTTMQIEAVDKEIATTQAAINKVDIEEKLAVIGFERQLLELRFRSLEAAKAMWPIQDKITEIDRQLNKLQQENLNIARQQNDLAIQMLPIQNAIADIDKQINEAKRVDYALQRQELLLQQQMLPLRAQIAEIDAHINRLTQEDFDLQMQTLAIQARMLPIQQTIADIDTRIALTQRNNLSLVRQHLELELQVAQQKQKQLNFEYAIDDVVNKRQGITQRRGILQEEEHGAGVTSQIAAIDAQIAAAVAARDYKGITQLARQRDALQLELDASKKKQDALQAEADSVSRRNEITKLGIELQQQDTLDILKPLQRKLDSLDAINSIEALNAALEQNSLEQYKRLLEDALRPLDAQLTAIKNISDINKLYIDLIVSGLNKEKSLLESQLKPLQDKLDALKREEEEKRLINDITINALEAEKQKLVDQLKPLQDKLDALEREKKEQELKNRVTILALEGEKRALQEQLQPLEDVRKAIERQTAEVELQKQATELYYEEKKLQLQAELLREQLRRADLEETRQKQEAVFENLVLEFLKAMNQSGAFSEDEATEVAKRLKLWDDQVAKIAENTQEMLRLQAAAEKVNSELSSIPRNIDVVITYRIVVIGSPPSGAPGPSGGGNAPAPTPGSNSGGGGDVQPPAPSGPSGAEPSGGDAGGGSVGAESVLRRGLLPSGIPYIYLPIIPPEVPAGYVNPNLSGRMHTPNRSSGNQGDVTPPRIPSGMPSGPPQWRASYPPPPEGAHVSSMTRAGTNVIIQNSRSATYQVNANYQQVQSPASVKHDLQAIVAMTQ